jgi:acetyl esterase/lipase
MIVFAAMVRVGWAQSLPADRPNPGTAVQATTVLTVADARSLVSTRNAAPDQQAFGDLDLSHVSEISPEAAAVLEGLPPPTGLLLNGLKSIGADVATALARSRCRQLSLNGLTEISPVVAAALAGYAGDPTADDPYCSQLNLDGVKDLPPSVLAVLGESHAGVLTLNGLTNIGADGARSLRNFDGVFVGLNGLESLTTDVAELLGRMRWRLLGLDGVRELSVESARGLATFEGNSLHLSGLARVSAAAAKELGHCRCKLLQLNGLTELSPEAAKSLAGFNGAALGLRRIAEVSVATAERLAGFRGRSLDLSGLQHPSDEVVRALLHCRGASLPADIETRVLASGDATLDVPYAATDERSQRLDLYLPKRPDPARRIPLVVAFHNQSGRSRKLGFQLLRPIVEDGTYAVAVVENRSPERVGWPAAVQDGKAAIRWLRANADRHGIDPERIGVVGFATIRGSLMAALLGTSGGVADLEGNLGEHGDTSSRVRCAVATCGPVDLTAIIAHGGRSKEVVLEMLRHGGEEPLAAARAVSPITHVTPDDAPLLIFHGLEHPTLPIALSEPLVAALRKERVEAECVPVPEVKAADFGTGSAWGDLETGRPDQDVMARVEDFLGRHLLAIKPKPKP